MLSHDLTERVQLISDELLVLVLDAFQERGGAE